jgi:hypothetical protein
MRKLLAPFLIIIVLALCQEALAQSPPAALKHFAAHGLSFDYPATVELEDHSSPAGQHLVLQSKGHAQIMIMARYQQINTADQLSEARREIVDSFVETIWQQMRDEDPNVSRAPSEIGAAGSRASGVRMRAVMNNEPGNAEIYSMKLGSRLVLLTLIGSDREIAAAAPTWLAIRRSLKIEVITISAMN